MARKPAPKPVVEEQIIEEQIQEEEFVKEDYMPPDDQSPPIPQASSVPESTPPDLPPGVTKEMVAKWKSRYGLVHMQAFTGRRIIFRGYTVEEAESYANSGDLEQQILDNCVLFIEGTGELLPTARNGILKVVGDASGSVEPGSRYTYVMDGSDKQSEAAFIRLLKKNNLEAGIAAERCLAQHGRALIFVTESALSRKLNAYWIFPEIRVQDIEGVPENKLTEHLLASRLFYPERIDNHLTMLAGHFNEVRWAVSQLLGYTPTSIPVEL